MTRSLNYPRRLLFALCLVACQAPAPPRAPTPSPGDDLLARARDYERGRGVARDYAAAAEIYRRLCDRGAGDLTACRRLIDAASEARGADRDLASMTALAATMCRRDDLLGCLIEAIASGGAIKDEAKLKRLVDAPCDAQHRARCELDRIPFGGFSQSSTAEYLNHEHDDTGCRLGVLEACARLRYAEGKEHDNAVRMMAAACAQGDASSCEAIGQPLSASERCQAHDFAGCLVLGCAGDAAAAAAALAHHAGNCVGTRGEGAGVRVATSPRLPLDSLEFHPVGTPLAGYEVYNVGTQPVALANIEIYGYDAADKPVDQQHVELRQVLAPGAGTLVNVNVTGARFEQCVSDIVFDDQTSHAARCPSRKPAHVRWGDGRGNLQFSISFPAIPLADGDAVETVLAAPYELAHPGVLIRQVTSGLLNLAAESTAPAWIDSWRVARGPQLALPLVLEPTTIVYQLDGVADLQLSADALAKIFSGQIARWNDPAIARDNPGRALPDRAIKVLQPYAPNDEARVTRYLTARAPRSWKLGERRLAKLFADASDWQMIGPLNTTPGAISYVGAGLAAKHALQVARIEGPGHTFVAPTTRAVSTGAYPIASLRTLYVPEGYPNAETAHAVRQYVDWLLSDGLANFEQIGYARPAEAVTRAARQQLARIAVRAQPVADTKVVDGEVTLKLRVVGRGRAGARVVHRQYDSTVALDKTTGRDGTLVIAHIPTAPQRYDLAVRGSDGSAGWVSVDVTKPGPIDVVAALHEPADPGVLRVRVVDPQNKPIADAQVSASLAQGVPTDARGETAVDLHGYYDATIQVWSSRGVSSPTGFELPQRAPVTIVVGQ